jgi:hypothetical protein
MPDELAPGENSNVDEFAFKVRFALAVMFQTVLLASALTVHVPVPIFIVWTPVAASTKPVPADPVIVGLNASVELQIVPVNALEVHVKIVKFVLQVTVPPPEAPSNVAVSDDPGTDEPPPAPELGAQCAVSLRFPVPPTQKRDAAPASPRLRANSAKEKRKRFIFSSLIKSVED